MSEPKRVMRAIVIGGSGALGRVVVATLAKEGARVAMTHHTDAIVTEGLLRAHDGLLARRVDVTDVAALSATLTELADALGGVDALVHAVAVSSTRTPAGFDKLADTDAGGFDRMMAVNVRSALVATQALAPRLAGGNVVLVGSIDGVKSVPAPAAYAASKAALSGMAQALAKELGPQRTCINVVAPGVLESGLSATLPDELKREYVKHSARKRLGKHEEVASVIAWLALSNTYVTGRTLVLDGGL